MRALRLPSPAIVVHSVVLQHDFTTIGPQAELASLSEGQPSEAGGSGVSPDKHSEGGPGGTKIARDTE